MRTVTVYGSSSPRTPLKYLVEARALGAGLARRGWTLITGAGKDGCMGAVADAALEAGGRVEGVILRQFVTEGLQHPAISEVLVADDMRSRKRLLAERADAFVALPGGPGTWEEVWEIAVQRQIKVTTAPLVCLDVDGFWEPFRAMLERAATDGLLYGPPEDILTVVADVDEALELIAH